MPRVRHHEQAPRPVPPDRHHRGVVHAVELLPDRPIQVPHEPDLLQRGKVSEHELAELLAERHHRFPVPADVGQRDARDDAAGAERYIVDVAATGTRPARDAPHPRHQTGHLDETGGLRVAGPRFRRLEAPSLEQVRFALRHSLASARQCSINGRPGRPASGPGPFPRLGSGSRASSRLGSGFGPRGCARPRRRDRNRDGSPRPARARSH